MKIAVDLDGTLAHYDTWRGIDHIGEPISLMVSRVKRWIEEGHEVVIFTARIDSPQDSYAVARIEKWLEAAGLPRLKVTNVKERDFNVFYDDRCVQVHPNTGELVTQRVWNLAEEIIHAVSIKGKV